MISLIWFLLVIFFLIAEVIAPGLTTIWFAGGAVAAMLLSLFQVPIYMQIIFFIEVSFVLLYFTRPLVKKFQQKPKEKTNYEALIGCLAKVIVEIDNEAQTGQVILNGQEWTARTLQENIKIPVDCLVMVEQISGVKLFVSKIENNFSGEVKIDGNVQI